jgi:hypothetical protein
LKIAAGDGLKDGRSVALLVLFRATATILPGLDMQQLEANIEGNIHGWEKSQNGELIRQRKMAENGMPTELF